MLFFVSRVMAAYMSESAIETIGSTCLTYIPSVQYEPMVSLGNEFLGDVAHKHLFSLQRILTAGGKPNALADAEYVSVNSHGCLIEYYGKYYVGGLAPHSRYGEQGIDVGWHFAAVSLNKSLCHSKQIASLVIGV